MPTLGRPAAWALPGSRSSAPTTASAASVVRTRRSSPILRLPVHREPGREAGPRPRWVAVRTREPGGLVGYLRYARPRCAGAVSPREPSGVLALLLAPAGVRAQSQPPPDKDAAVILVVDASKSMKADDGSGRPKMAGRQGGAQHARRRAARRRQGRPADLRVGGRRHREGGGLRGHEARLTRGAAGPRRAEGLDRRDHAARVHADRRVAAGRGEGPRHREAEDGRAGLRRRRQLRAAGAVRRRAPTSPRAASRSGSRRSASRSSRARGASCSASPTRAAAATSTPTTRRSSGGRCAR